MRLVRLIRLPIQREIETREVETGDFPRCRGTGRGSSHCFRDGGLYSDEPRLVKGEAGGDLYIYIPIFHSWIRTEVSAGWESSVRK
jgi:hypothetical protein